MTDPRVRHLTRDGIRIAFEEAGDGAAPPLLLVHGLSCDRTLMRPLLERYAASRHVVSVDLRGHGESDPGGPYRVELFVDDLEWLVSQLDLERPVVVGHSLGGLLAVELGARRHGDVGAVVALDTIFFPDELASWRPGLGAMLGKLSSGQDAEAAHETWIRTVHIGPADDPVTAERILEVMRRTPLSVTLDLVDEIRAWDSRHALGRVPVPVLVVCAEAGSPQDPSRLCADLPHLYVGSTVGSGHFVQLMVPDQVTAMIDQFLRIAGDEHVEAREPRPVGAARSQPPS